MMRRLSWFSLLGLLLVMLVGNALSAQDDTALTPSADPTDGTRSVTNEYNILPIELAITGTVDAAAALEDPNCAGFVTPEPTFRLSWTFLSDSRYYRYNTLAFTVAGDAPSLIVYDAQMETYLCAQREENTAPLVQIRRAPAGDYLVWVSAPQADAVSYSELAIESTVFRTSEASAPREQRVYTSVWDLLSELNDGPEIINSVAFTYDLGQVVIYDDYRYWWQNIPQSLINTLEAAHRDERPIRRIEFSGTVGWVVIYQDGMVEWNAIREDLAQQLAALVERGQTIRDVAITSATGWVVLYGENEAVWEDIPDTLSDRILQYYDEGRQMKQVDFRRNDPDGWVLAFDRNGAAWNGVDEATSDRILTINEDDSLLSSFSFSPEGGWFIIEGRDGYWYGDMDTER